MSEPGSSRMPLPGRSPGSQTPKYDAAGVDGDEGAGQGADGDGPPEGAAAVGVLMAAAATSMSPTRR